MAIIVTANGFRSLTHVNRGWPEPGRVRLPRGGVSGHDPLVDPVPGGIVRWSGAYC